MFLQAQAAFVTGAPALQCDIGVQRIVARAHGGAAAAPITGDEMRRVRSDGAHPADCPGSGYHRQLQQVFALAAEDFVRIGQHAGCDDIDNDLAGPQHWVGQGLDGKWRSERMVMADPRRSEFGVFLRSRREKLSPKAVGIASGRRRRTAGPRREEVAELAGIGVDWYIRLEQGRTVSPSVTTIDALARALRLSKPEHAHLRALARDADRRAFARERVPEALLRLVN